MLTAGRFLWVHFQLRTICAQKSDASIIAALDNLPRDLPQTYERILSGITETDDIDICKRIFQWVATVKRPLTLEELREAIGIEPLQQEWDSSRFVNDMNQAIASCGNLIFIEEEHQAVHYTHYSVKQYLLSEAISTSLRPYHIDLERADAEVGAVCVTYLDFGIFSRQVARTTGNGKSIASIPSTVLKETLPHRTLGNKIALALLQRQYKSGSAVSRPLEDTLGDTEAFRKQRMQEQYSFLSYAREFWLEHTKSATGLISQNPRRLWSNLINDANLPGPSTSVPWTYEDWTNGADTVIDWIIKRNHSFLAQLMIHSHVGLPEKALQHLFDRAVAWEDGRLVGMVVSSGRVSKADLSGALQIAAKRGDMELVNQLISLKADINTPAGSDSRTPLQAAAGGGHMEIVEKLLAKGADTNASASWDNGRTALQAAAEGGHLEVVEKLLAEGADINASAGLNRGRTALQAAAEGGHMEVVEKLLAEGADINASTSKDYGRTASQAAAEGGHSEVVEKLLAEGADINASAGLNRGRTALQAAAEGGHLEVVEKLLAKGADVDALASNFGGRTALQAAAEGGHMEVVETLLAKGADVNALASGGIGRTALQAAAEGGHMEVVETLLAKGADVNALASEYYGRTALQAAAEQGHMEVVETLLAKGADVDAPLSRFEGKTALQAAAEQGHMDIVEELLAKGADINASASVGGRTALQAAAEGGHMVVVEKLLAKGADVNAPGSESFGKTALQAASDRGHTQIVELLRKKGAKC